MKSPNNKRGPTIQHHPNKRNRKIKLKQRVKRYVALLMATAIMSILFSCGEQSIVKPQAEQPTEMVTRKTSELTFLKSKRPFALFKVMEVSQVITAAQGGTVEAGDDTTGISWIIFNPGDVSEDLQVGFWWDSQAFEAQFTPHGSQFNNPVTIRLAYKDADLGGVAEDDLKIWYYNENDELWELTGQVINKDEKYVEGTTTHFSRFAIGSD